MATIAVTQTPGIRDRLAARTPGAVFADAPVPGSKDPAGPAADLASGPAAAPGTAGPVSGIIGRKTVRLGEAGRGSQVKLVVNAYMSVLIEGAAETMALAGRLGIGHPQLAGVIEGGPLDAPIADAKLRKTDRRDYASEFPWSGRWKMRTWRSAPRVARTCRCWQRCPADDTRPQTPGMAERTSAPPAWPCASRALTSEKAKDQTQIWPSGAKPMRPAQIRRP